MDETRFDSLARTLAGAATRRRTLAGLLVGAIPAVILVDEVDAGKRRKQRNGKADKDAPGRRDQQDAVESEKKKKRKKKKKPATTPPPATQPPTQVPLSCTGGTTLCSGICVDTTNDTQHCGACGNVCEGADQTASSDVTCAASACALTCKGQNYDVDGNAENGCEQLDTQSNHASESAQFLGNKPCDDGPSTGSFSGTISSDQRAHANPAAAGFDPVTGAAPLWYRVFATGGLFCANDPAITATMTGGTSGCYKLVMITNLGTHESTFTSGSASIDLDSGSYSDGSAIFFRVEKTCPAVVRETASFTASFHL